MKPVSLESSGKDSNRRVLKPIIEKRRRERINSHLEELKNLVCGNTRSKLEKADILELTVNHLRKLIAAQRRTQPPTPTNNNTNPLTIPHKPMMDPTRAGYMPCAQEMQRLMVKNVNDNIIEAQRQQRLSVSSPTSSCSSLSPVSPNQPFVFLPMMPQHSQLIHSTRAITSTQEAKSEVWRPW